MYFADFIYKNHCVGTTFLKASKSFVSTSVPPQVLKSLPHLVEDSSMVKKCVVIFFRSYVVSKNSLNEWDRMEDWTREDLFFCLESPYILRNHSWGVHSFCRTSCYSRVGLSWKGTLTHNILETMVSMSILTDFTVVTAGVYSLIIVHATSEFL